MTDTQSFVLTIAIPTYNRADFLELCLKQLEKECATLAPGLVEVLVSDNCSSDRTAQVVTEAQSNGLEIRYICNATNIGSDANIAQCFNQAQGHYVQILGDDDLYLAGKLSDLIAILQKKEHGMVCLRSYGYENDFEKEHPGSNGKILEFDDLTKYLHTIGPLICFISACVINRRVLTEIDANKFCGTNLVQVNLVLLAILKVPTNLYLTDYYLACKRANSGGYDFSEVFVERLFNIMDTYVSQGLPPQAIETMTTQMLISYYPFSLLRLRLSRGGDLVAAQKRFKARFGQKLLYTLWVAPILWLPRLLAIAWGGLTVLIGRTIHGDLRRGMYFAFHRLTGKR